jgi:hypothetical protein
MAFLKRLGFYLFGLSIGLVFLTIFFKNKSERTGFEFCYFPNCRTLKDIRSKSLSYSKAVEELILNQELDSIKIAYFLREGDVDFKSSDTKSTPCKTYVIKADLAEKPAVMTVKNCEGKALVEGVVFK